MTLDPTTHCSTPPTKALLALAGSLLLLASTPPAAAARPGSPGSVQFRGSSFPVEEEAGEVTVVVRRSQGETGEVSVDYSTTAGSATEGEDYEPVAGTLVWEDGDRSDRAFTIPILDDGEDEGLETFGVLLENPTGGVGIGAVDSTVVRIKPSDRTDDDDDDGDDGDDEEEAGVLKLTRAAYPAFESAGEATFSVERDDGDFGEVTVEYMTVDGSGTQPDDYLPTAGTLTWADGEDGEQEVVVPLVDDEEAEGDETITVLLTNATGGASLGVRDSASITVLDDDGGDSGCVPDEETLCLHNGRFEITGSWETGEGESGAFQMIPTSDDAGMIWFFSAENVELVVKLLDGCGVNDHFWVFYAAVTNVGFEMEVLDLESGESRTYSNAIGEVPETVTDIEAFATCG